jgi:hypothetical protein
MFKFQRNFFSNFKKLPNLRKYGEFKFNFKNFLADLPLHISNVQNRKADANPEMIEKLYQEFTKQSNDLNLMRKRLNEVRN